MKKSTRRWLVWGLALPLALIAAAFTVRFVNLHRNAVASERFAALPQTERNLAIYDAFRATLDEHYFDRKLLATSEWRARLADWREKAAAAPDDMHLYTDVFFPLAQKFPHSHVGISQLPDNPSVPLLRNVKRPEPGTAAAARAERLNALWDSGPGFDLVKLQRGERFLMIVGDVVAASPADKAGIEPGWLVLSMSMRTIEESVRLEGEFLRLTPDQASDLERGTNFAVQESEVAARTVKLAYNYEPLPKRLPFESRQLPGGVTYLRLDSFNESALVDRALSTIDAAGPSGLIIDLRHNTGGLLSEAQRMIGRVLPEGAHIGTAEQSDSLQILSSPAQPKKYTGPLAVLVGPGTVSAGEVSAAAVHDNKRGRLIGRATNGSVLYSRSFPLPGGWQVMVPISDYVRTGGRRIEGVGVEPDLHVMPSLAELRAGRDPVIERAVAALRD